MPLQPAIASRKSAFQNWLQLFRAPNLFTAPGDPLAGFLLANQAYGIDGSLPMAIGASLLFYAGGLLLNDIADVEEDRRDRPNRPLPSGAVQQSLARNVAIALLMAALCLCWVAGGEYATRTLLIGGSLLAAIVSYNLRTKHVPVLGALNMGACRSLSMLLGASVGPYPFIELAIFPAVLTGLYIAAVTNLARHETHSNVPPLARLLPSVAIAILGIGMTRMASMSPQALPAIGLFAAAAAIVFFMAVRMFQKSTPIPPMIGWHIRVLLLLQAGICWIGQPYDNGLWAAAILIIFFPLSYFAARRFYAS
jgi:UbiA prenyltransferase family